MEMEFVQRKLCTVKCVHKKKLKDYLCKCEILQRRVNRLQSFHFQAVQHEPTWCQQAEISWLITMMVIRDVLQ